MTTVGAGGFGKAKITTYNGQTAVVKYINTTSDPRATLATCTINRKDAQYEGEIMKLFNHVNIAKIYEIRGHCIFMKYYPLGSLRDMINKGNVNSNRYLIALGILDGLQKIHDLNYVHCDLKASNILCEEIYCEGIKYIRPVISDFGGAKLKGSYLGAYTPGFCPKEVLSDGKPIDFSTDIYSMGKLLIELFTHRNDISDITESNFDSKLDLNDFNDNYYDGKEVDSTKRIFSAVKKCLNSDRDERISLIDLRWEFIMFATIPQGYREN